MRILIWSYTAGLAEMPVWEAYIFTQVFPAMFVALNPAQRVRGSLNKHKQT